MDFAKLILRVRGANAVTDPEVAQALKLSDTQVLRIKDIHRQNSSSLRTRLQALMDSSENRPSLRETLRKLTQESEKNVISLLNSDQQQKLARLQGNSR